MKGRVARYLRLHARVKGRAWQSTEINGSVSVASRLSPKDVWQKRYCSLDSGGLYPTVTIRNAKKA